MMENSIIIEIKLAKGNEEIETLRNQGLLFDRIRQSLNSSDEEIDEISLEEYKILENFRNNKNDKS